MSYQTNLPEYGADLNGSHPIKSKAVGRSCASSLFGMFCSSGFLLSGVWFATIFYLLDAPQDYALIAGGIFLFAFFWQRSSSRKGCFMPIFIFAMFLFWETLVVGVLVYQTRVYEKIDFEQIKKDLKREAPEAFELGIKLFNNVEKQGKLVFSSALEAAKNAVEDFKLSDEDRKIINLETAFRNNPGNPAVVMSLADAYLAKNDLASTMLATSLYEALVETDPCDTSLQQLADGYARLGRLDLAYATAARRASLPLAHQGKVARQLAYLAATSGNLNRGISELEKLLKLNPLESEEIKLLLAALYKDVGNNVLAITIVDQVLAETPAVMAAAKEASALKKQLVEN